MSIVFSKNHVSAVLGLCGLLMALPLLAQSTPTTSSTPQSSLGPRLGLSAFLYDPATASVSVDLMPTACTMAALREEERATQTVAAQRARFIARPDTLALSPQAVHTAQTCGSSWTAANTDPFQLPGLFRLALLTGQESRAQAAGIRWMHTAGTQDTARGEALMRQIQWLSDTRPLSSSRYRLIHQVMDSLYALGPGAVEQQIDGAAYLRELAAMTGAYPRELALADTVQQLVRRIPSGATRWYFKEVIFENMAAEVPIPFLFPFDLTDRSFQSMIERNLKEAQKTKDAVAYNPIPVRIPKTFHAYLFDKGGLSNDSLTMAMGLDSVSTLTADHWYGRSDSSVTYPRRGVLTVLMHMEVCNPSCGSNEQLFAAWRRLYTEFAPKGVDFILLTRTRGFFGMSTRLPAAAEVDSIRTYLRDRLELPGILGIDETHFATLPDGRKAPIVHSAFDEGVVTRDGLFWQAVFGYDLSTPAVFTGYHTFLASQLTQRKQ